MKVALNKPFGTMLEPCWKDWRCNIPNIMGSKIPNHCVFLDGELNMQDFICGFIIPCKGWWTTSRSQRNTQMSQVYLEEKTGRFPLIAPHSTVEIFRCVNLCHKVIKLLEILPVKTQIWIKGLPPKKRLKPKYIYIYLFHYLYKYIYT